MPINDFFAKNGWIREDGRMIHDMYVFLVKKPNESKYPWDYYEVVARSGRGSIPAARQEYLTTSQKVGHSCTV